MIKRLFSLTLAVLLAAFTMGLNSAATAAALSSKTAVLVQSDSSISETTNKTGDIVNFHIAKPVLDTNGNVIIEAGTPVKATITRLETMKRIGRHTELDISGFSTTVKGKQVILNGEIKAKSVSRMARSIVLSALVFPLFLLMKGAAVELPAGSQTTVYPALDYSL